MKSCARKMAGLAMVAPNQKAQQGNNNWKALGDIGNVVGARNPKCNINKDVVMERSRVNLVVNANKRANPSTQQFQADDIVVKAGAKAEAKAVRGNKQRRIVRRKAENDTARKKDNVVSIGDSVDSSAQDGGLQTSSQLKAMKPIAQSQTAVLTARSEVAQEVLPSIDDGDLGNQLAVAEYVGDIYKSYQKIEGPNSRKEKMQLLGL